MVDVSRASQPSIDKGTKSTLGDQQRKLGIVAKDHFLGEKSRNFLVL
jgi:hypothetical protein